MHPTEGVRILLERRTVADDGRSAVYLASLFTPEARFDFEARLAAGGEVALTPAGVVAEADLEKKLLAIARSVARAAGRKIGEGLPPWPHRVNRWRAIAPRP